MAQQTAVEWLASEINSRGPKENNPPQWLQELYEQAKEMEKQRHSETWHDSRENTCIPFEQYYTETYTNESR
jgi:hypothetical protein